MLKDSVSTLPGNIDIAHVNECVCVDVNAFERNVPRLKTLPLLLFSLVQSTLCMSTRPSPW